MREAEEDILVGLEKRNHNLKVIFGDKDIKLPSLDHTLTMWICQYDPAAEST